MRILMTSASIAAALATGALAIFAQWPDYPTKGPRTPEGKVDLTAPPPRTPDGKIDFSGLWEQARQKGFGAGKGKDGKAKDGKIDEAKAKAAPPPPPTAPGEPPVA